MRGVNRQRAINLAHVCGVSKPVYKLPRLLCQSLQVTPDALISLPRREVTGDELRPIYKVSSLWLFCAFRHYCRITDRSYECNESLATPHSDRLHLFRFA